MCERDTPTAYPTRNRLLSASLEQSQATAQLRWEQRGSDSRERVRMQGSSTARERAA